MEGEKGQGETFVNVIRPSLSLGELAELRRARREGEGKLGN